PARGAVSVRHQRGVPGAVPDRGLLQPRPGRRVHPHRPPAVADGRVQPALAGPAAAQRRHPAQRRLQPSRLRGRSRHQPHRLAVRPHRQVRDRRRVSERPGRGGTRPARLAAGHPRRHHGRTLTGSFTCLRRNVMRAVWITGTGGPGTLEIRETADPRPGPGQVRIRVQAAGLGFAEVMAAQGLYPDAPKTPCVVGYEVAGVVDALGDGAEGHPMGARVLALTHFGGHADVVCVPAEQVFAIPGDKSFEEAAALPVSYLTAYHLLFRAAGIRPGERVLVHMAAGGTGLAVLQLCRTVGDVEVFGTASAAKHETL